MGTTALFTVKQSRRILSLTGLLLVLVGCEHSDLQALEHFHEAHGGNAVVSGHFCTLKPDPLAVPMKFIFIIDESGSNNDAGLPGTDPTGQRRFDSIVHFLQSPPTGKDYFSLITFEDAPTIVSPFTQDRNAFTRTVQQAKASRVDLGGTNFVDTIGRATQLISQDVQANLTLTDQPSANYLIFFVSDGQPTVGGTTATEVLAAIDTLKALETNYPEVVDGIQLNTGHYFREGPDDGAAMLMELMAARGGGQFIDFKAQGDIDFNRFDPPPSLLKHQIKDVLVRDINTVWEGGDLLLDSDGDGLSDELEAHLGSNPLKADSDGNGVSDLVEMRSRGTPCLDAHCDPKKAAVYPNCASLRLPNGTFPDTDGDGLNDCEEVILKSDFRRFDTNGDWVPDGLEFRDGLAFLKNTMDLYEDPDGDGINNYLELKSHTPARYPNDGIMGLRPYHYIIDFSSDDDRQTCYDVTVSNIMTLTPSDSVLIQLMEFTSEIKEHRYLRATTLPVINGSVIFNDADLKLVGHR